MQGMPYTATRLGCGLSFRRAWLVPYIHHITGFRCLWDLQAGTYMYVIDTAGSQTYNID
jgi:hypothetical protein